MITFIDLSDIYHYHESLLQEFGGEGGVRDDRLIQSAYHAAFQGFGDVDFYPTVVEKAVRLGYGLAKNHGFVDGNKRVGCLTMLSFLRLNGVELSCTQETLAEKFYEIAEGTLDYTGLLTFVKTNMQVKQEIRTMKQNIVKVNVREACRRYAKKLELQKRRQESIEGTIEDEILNLVQDSVPNADVDVSSDGTVTITQE